MIVFGSYTEMITEKYILFNFKLTKKNYLEIF